MSRPSAARPRRILLGLPAADSSREDVETKIRRPRKTRSSVCPVEAREVERHPARARPRPRRPVPAAPLAAASASGRSRTRAVVDLALLLVGEHLVRLRDLLKRSSATCRRVPSGWYLRATDGRHFLISSGSRPACAQNLIEVSFAILMVNVNGNGKWIQPLSIHHLPFPIRALTCSRHVQVLGVDGRCRRPAAEAEPPPAPVEAPPRWPAPRPAAAAPAPPPW